MINGWGFYKLMENFDIFIFKVKLEGNLGRVFL